MSIFIGDRRHRRPFSSTMLTLFLLPLFYEWLLRKEIGYRQKTDVLVG
jgi:hypothetical protein